MERRFSYPTLFLVAIFSLALMPASAMAKASVLVENRNIAPGEVVDVQFDAENATATSLRTIKIDATLSGNVSYGLRFTAINDGSAGNLSMDYGIGTVYTEFENAGTFEFESEPSWVSGEGVVLNLVVESSEMKDVGFSEFVQLTADNITASSSDSIFDTWCAAVWVDFEYPSYPIPSRMRFGIQPAGFFDYCTVSVLADGEWIWQTYVRGRYWHYLEVEVPANTTAITFSKGPTSSVLDVQAYFEYPTVNAEGATQLPVWTYEEDIQISFTDSNIALAVDITAGIVSVSMSQYSSQGLVPDYSLGLEFASVVSEHPTSFYKRSSHWSEWPDQIRCDWVIMSIPNLDVPSVISFRVIGSYMNASALDVQVYANSSTDSHPSQGALIHQGTYQMGEIVEVEVPAHTEYIGLCGSNWWMQFTKPVLTTGTEPVILPPLENFRMFRNEWSLSRNYVLKTPASWSAGDENDPNILLITYEQAELILASRTLRMTNLSASSLTVDRLGVDVVSGAKRAR